MRTAYRVWSVIAAGTFCLVAFTDLSGGLPRLVPTAVTTAAAPPVATGMPTVTVDTAEAGPGGPAVVTGPVTRVTGGDRLEVAGQPVRVLGIRSCDPGTPGGRRAEQRATALLAGRTVALRAEPGTDRDRTGDELRYVEAGGRDFGLAMIGHGDTGVDESRAGDIDPTYLTQLRAAGTGPVVCGR